MGGCFDPPEAPISFLCGPQDECPNGYECRDDGCCHLIGSDDSETCTVADAATPPPDAGPTDAPVVDGPAADAMADAMIDGMPADAAIDATMIDAGPGANVGDIIITEFAALTSTGTNLGEFVELRNVSPGTIDLAGWTLSANGTANTLVASSLDMGDPIPVASGQIIYGVPNPADPGDIPVDAAFVYGPAGAAFELNNAGADLRINDGVNDIDIVDFTGWETDPAGTPAANQFAGLTDRSTQLVAAAQSEADNDDGAAWCVPAVSTRGAVNSACEPIAVNEVLADPLGADERLEFIELRVVPGADLTGARLRSTDGNGVPNGVDYTFAAGARAPLDGLLVVADNTGGATLVANADIQTALVLPDASGGLQLIAAGGGLVDAVGYGSLAVGTDTVDGLAIVEGTASSSAAGAALARNAAGTDSNDNSVDIHLDPTPTPGADNDMVAVSVSAVSPDNGLASAGQTVLVSGADFITGAQVTVNGAAAACTVTAADTMTCTFPDNGGAALVADVSVQNPDASMDTLSGGYTFTGVLPDPGATFWCNTQFPASTTTMVGMATENIYGQIYVAGMTDSDPNPVPGISGQIGYGADGADPTAVNFTWADTTPNPGYDFSQNNDEHQGVLTVNMADTYDYAYRFSLDGGLNYYYCDTSGSDDGYSPGDAGSLTVN